MLTLFASEMPNQMIIQFQEIAITMPFIHAFKSSSSAIINIIKVYSNFQGFLA